MATRVCECLEVISNGIMRSNVGPQLKKSKVVIVGTGFGGLAAAIALKQAGENDFVILERANEVGGVWRDNVYPGCACDVESQLFSFSFALNAKWKRRYSSQAEIHEYLKDCTRKFQLHSHIQFACGVTRMEWLDSEAVWKIETDQGTYQAAFAVAAAGSLSVPAIPNIPGLSNFKGTVVHTAAWPKDLNLTGKRVAVVGTGASAIQVIPELQKMASFLYVFQRTPAWVLPRNDHPVPNYWQSSFRRWPLLQKFLRLKVYLRLEFNFLGFQFPKLMRLAEAEALEHIESVVKDPRLRQQLTPNYTIGCKRILLSDDYYPSLIKENVKVVSEELESVSGFNGLIGKDGSLFEVDAIVFATGFKTKEMPFSKIVFGKKSISLSESWQGSPQTYFGTMVSDFPNFFILAGPQTGLGHSSAIYMIEAQVNQILALLRHTQKNQFRVVEPDAKAQEKFMAGYRKSMEKTVWMTGGCKSWYLDSKGFNSSLWPSFTFVFKSATAKVKSDDYIFR